MDLVIVKHRLDHARGTRVAGVSGGRMYIAHPDTLLLHAVTSGSLFAEEPGCHPEDAEEFAQFRAFQVVKAAAGPRVPPPPPLGPSAPTLPSVEVEQPAADDPVSESPSPAGGASVAPPSKQPRKRPSKSKGE